MSADPIFSVSGLTKAFGEGEGEVLVLRGIDLAMEAGEMTALLGPSGSGKSTLLTILGTLMRASGGSHAMLGVDLMHASDAERTEFRSRHLGFVFQFHHLLPDLSALENVMMPAAAAAGRETRAMRSRAMDLLDAVGLADRRDYRPSAMSGGQRQRAALARALINNPVLVLADEPTGNLDQKTGQRIVELLFALNREQGATLVLVTHDAELAAYCDRILELDDGRLRSPSAQQPESV